ncbi:putative translation initiation factor IF-2 [Papiliotrema laurentii]|uniref:Ribosome biogenesis protein NOP53 n=1 Tax=Papiliotrema laurentii TaxID=5418 RepID=A0AAD9FM26_PAPLA|nr:putative translation initiation factor IF-2 [Papiliotrema laurentii]
MPSVAASSSKKAAKPYDRPADSGKGKGKALPTSVESRSVNIGAPAQLGQKSRKGKKAWRKNVDISQEEVAMEQAREEERVTGGRVTAKKNDDLFVVDTVGDVAVAQRMRRAPKPLRSLAVLSEQSAVPSLKSKPSSSATVYRKTKISPAEKERLRRIARRVGTGALHATDGPIRSADVKAIGPTSTDAWTEPPAPAPVKGGFGEETIVKRQVKTPKTLAARREIYLESQVQNGRGVELPDEGTSYNPRAEAHSRLIELAVEEELAQIKKEEEEAKRIATLGEVVNARRQPVQGDEYAPGMVVGPGEVEGEDDDESDDEASGSGKVVKPTKRKTQAQRNKAKRAKEQARLEALEKTQRRLQAEITSLGKGGIKKALEERQKKMEEAEKLAKIAKKERERLGLEGGEKIGKHRVGKSKVTVQLGEDLAESLRQVKPEGNLFKDRFLALQKKALIEPRVPQLPKRRALRTKEYEKHAYKRFT